TPAHCVKPGFFHLAQLFIERPLALGRRMPHHRPQIGDVTKHWLIFLGQIHVNVASSFSVLSLKLNPHPALPFGYAKPSFMQMGCVMRSSTQSNDSAP